MADPHTNVWAKIAAEIAAEKRPAPKPETPQAAQAKIVDRLVAEVVKARLNLAGITDPEKIAAAAKRVTVTDTGELVGLDAEGRHGVGTGPNRHLSLDDVVKDLGVSTKAVSQSPGKVGADDPVVNPFAKGPNYSITAQMLLMKDDPERAEHMQYLASVGKA